MTKRPRRTRPKRKRVAQRADVSRIRELRAVFRDVHKHGQAALKEGNYKQFGDAIAVERNLIQEQSKAIKAQNDDIQKQRAVVANAESVARKRRS